MLPPAGGPLLLEVAILRQGRVNQPLDDRLAGDLDQCRLPERRLEVEPEIALVALPGRFLAGELR